MKRSWLRTSALGLAAVAVAFAAAACSADPTATPTPRAAPTPTTPPAEPVKFGSIMDLTGELAEYGKPMEDAVHLAAQHFNDAGGVLGGAEIVIVAEDGGTSDVIAVEAARKLVTVDQVSAVVGPLASGITTAVANAVTVPNEIPQVSSSATAPSITVLEDNDFLFRTAPSDAFQGVILAELARSLGYESAGVLFINNAYGQGLADNFEAAFTAMGGSVVKVPHESEQPSYASEIDRVTADDPDVVVAVSYPVSAGVYVREAIESGAADTFLFVDGTKSEDLVAAVGAENLEGMFGTAPEAVESAATMQFDGDYSAAYGSNNQPFIRETYDAAVILGLAVEAAGSADPVAIRDAMRAVSGPPGVEVGPGAAEIQRALELLRSGQDINYQGASGPVDLDENGDVAGAMGIWKIENGQIVTDRVVTGFGQELPTAMPGPARSEPVKLGSIMDLTGELAEYGSAMESAVHLAAQHFNDAGGVLGGAEVVIVAEDGGTSDVIAVEAARKLVNVDRVSGIVGPLASGITIAVANAVTVPNEIPQVSSSATAPSITVLEDNDFLFRTAPSDAFQGVILAELATSLGYRSAGVLFINNAYGQGLADNFEAAFTAMGGSVVKVPHESEQPSYASEIDRVTANDPDVLVAVSYPVSAGVYIREAIESGAADTFLLVDGTKSDDLIAAVGAANLEGTYGTAPEAVAGAASMQFDNDYSAAYGASGQPFIRETYDAAVILGLAIEAAGSNDPVAVRDAMRAVSGPPGVEVGPGAAEIARALELLRDGQDINYQGASGPVDLDENGDVAGAMGIWKIQGGQLVTDRVVTGFGEDLPTS